MYSSYSSYSLLTLCLLISEISQAVYPGWYYILQGSDTNCKQTAFYNKKVSFI